MRCRWVLKIDPLKRFTTQFDAVCSRGLKIVGLCGTQGVSDLGKIAANFKTSSGENAMPALVGEIPTDNDHAAGVVYNQTAIGVGDGGMSQHKEIPFVTLMCPLP